MIRCIFATLIINISLIFSSFSADNVAFVSRENCQRLTAHIPRDDVEYKGGVDVKGRPVVPADITPHSDFGVGNVISFLLILDAAKEGVVNKNAKNILRQNPELWGELYLGQIMIVNNQAFLNGRPLIPEQQQQLYRFCREKAAIIDQNHKR